MGSYIEKDVECPFFLWDDGQMNVQCEGVNASCRLRLMFRNKDAWQRYTQKYCCQDFRACRVYEMLMKKYEG